MQRFVDPSAARKYNLLVMHRSTEKVAAACRGLSGKGGKISSYTCDLGSFSQIKKLTEDTKADFSSIDVLINNAGVFEQRKTLSEDGFEMTWAVNVLAPFLLTSLLKDMITERIINVSSISAGSTIDFDNLQQVAANKCSLVYHPSAMTRPSCTSHVKCCEKACANLLWCCLTCMCVSPSLQARDHVHLMLWLW